MEKIKQWEDRQCLLGFYDMLKEEGEKV